MNIAVKATSQDTIDRLSAALDSGTFVDVRRMLNGLPPADVAHLLESSPPKTRAILWRLVFSDLISGMRDPFGMN